MNPDPHKVRAIADEIIHLEERLSEAQLRLRNLFEGIPTLELTPAIRNSGGRPSREDSAPSRILAELDADPLTHWDAVGLSEHLKIKKRVVESALYNLSKAEKIARPSRGKYASKHEPVQEQVAA